MVKRSPAALSYMKNAAACRSAPGKQAAADQLQADRLQVGNAQLVAEPLRQPCAHVRALGARHFDRMAHLDDVELVRVERVAAKTSKPVCVAGAAADAPRAIQPAEPPTTKASDRGRRRHRQPRAADLAGQSQHVVELEPLRHRLVGDRAVARADALGLRPPGGDQRGLFRMLGKPGRDGGAAVGRQLAVDKGVQLFFGHG